MVCRGITRKNRRAVSMGRYDQQTFYKCMQPLRVKILLKNLVVFFIFINLFTHYHPLFIHTLFIGSEINL